MQNHDTAEHYLECKHIELVNRRERVIWNLRSDLRKWGASPVIGSWLLHALGGETPSFHNIQPLRLNQAAKRAYADQNTIGWRHLTKGRSAKSLTDFQREWDRVYPENKRSEKEDQKDMLAKCLGMCLLANYEIWKERSKEVLKVEPPTKKKIQLEKISELVEKVDSVEVRDKFLFAPDKVSKVDYSLQAMED